MTTELIAFLDESRKPIRNPKTRRVGEPGRYYYVVAAAVVIDGDIPNIRSQLGRVEAGLGYPLHYRELSTARRVSALEAIDRIDGWDGYLYETARPLPGAGYSEHHVRAKIIAEAFTHLSSQGVVEAVLALIIHGASWGAGLSGVRAGFGGGVCSGFGLVGVSGVCAVRALRVSGGVFGLGAAVGCAVSGLVRWFGGVGGCW